MAALMRRAARIKTPDWRKIAFALTTHPSGVLSEIAWLATVDFPPSPFVIDNRCEHECLPPVFRI
jgi:hypothetical protein